MRVGNLYIQSHAAKFYIVRYYTERCYTKKKNTATLYYTLYDRVQFSNCNIISNTQSMSKGAAVSSHIGSISHHETSQAFSNWLLMYLTKV